MNKELLEKLSAIREDLVAFQAQAQAADVKKLAELVMHKWATFVPNYYEIIPYMNGDQKATIDRRMLPILDLTRCIYEQGKDCPLTVEVERGVPELLADLDDIEKAIKERAPSSTGET